MDVEIMYFRHDFFPTFWPLYSAFWRDVTGQDLEKYVNIKRDDKLITITKLEKNLHDTLGSGKSIKLAVYTGIVVGFIQYRYDKQSDVAPVDAIFVHPDFRGKGISKLLLNSIIGAKRAAFSTKIGAPPKELLSKARNLDKKSNTEDLQAWELNIEDSSPEKVLQLKRGT